MSMVDARPTVSVVVPAYNACETLSECIASILYQDFSDFEVIVVDDGSVDGTLELAESLAGSDSRVHVVTQPKGGVSRARNLGIGLAHGEYICFVDADDWLLPQALDQMLASGRRYGSDMVYGDFEYSYEGVIVASEQMADFRSGTISARDALRSLASMSPRSISGSCCRVLFRNKFLQENSAAFPEGITMSEDYCFILGCLRADPVISYAPGAVYRVRRDGRGGSATQRYMPQMQRSMDFVNGRLAEACQGDAELERLYAACVANTAWSVCGNVFKSGSDMSFSEKYRVVKATLKQYGPEISKLDGTSGMPRQRETLLRLGAKVPLLLACAFAANTVKRERHR